jgi:hypothetical protein
MGGRPPQAYFGQAVGAEQVDHVSFAGRIIGQACYAQTSKFPAGDVGLILVPIGPRKSCRQKGTPQGRGVKANHPQA